MCLTFLCGWDFPAAPFCQERLINILRKTQLTSARFFRKYYIVLYQGKVYNLRYLLLIELHVVYIFLVQCTLFLIYPALFLNYYDYVLIYFNLRAYLAYIGKVLRNYYITARTWDYKHSGVRVHRKCITVNLFCSLLRFKTIRVLTFRER